MTGSAAPDDSWHRIAGTSQTLVRSRLEIARILKVVADRATPLTAYFPVTDRLFMSRLRQVDEEAGFLAIDYGTDKAANADVLAAASVRFGSSEDGAGIEFIGADPRETLIDGVPAIRCAFPGMLMIQQRRVHRRVAALPGVPLRCIADTRGVISFEAEIVDISLGGIGAMVYDAGVILAPATVLRGCKIIHPGGTVVDVDIEIRYSVAAVLEDGTPARRSGCRFLGMPAQLEELVRVFVVDLEKAQ